MEKKPELALPKIGKMPFNHGKSSDEFSWIGWGDVNTQFFGYMRGYKNGADHLIDIALEDGKNFALDTYVYPICFLYRQYLELIMKWIYLTFSLDDDITKEKTIKNVGHNLIEIWYKVKSIIKLGDQIDESILEATEIYIKQFNDFDKTSFTFRYPINKQLKQLLSSEEVIDLINLKERMNELYNLFTSRFIGGL